MNNKLFPHISFNEASHTYTDLRNKQTYQSVTSFIGRYKAPFDKIGIATNLAQKRGCTIDEILDEWNGASEFGTRVHKCIEDFLQGVFDWSLPTKPFTYQANNERTNEIFSFITHLFSLPIKGKLEQELILADTDLKLCGMADLVCFDNDGAVDVWDWKTNKTIEHQAYGGKVMKAPFNDMPDANYFHYSLQLNIYAMMLAKLGFKVRSLNLVHLKPGGGIMFYPIKIQADIASKLK